MKGLLVSRNGRIGLGAAGLALVIAAAWFLLISPQRTKASDLDKDIAAAESDLAQRRVAVATPMARVTVKASDTFRLTKALPNATNMAGVLLDVNRIAARNDLDFSSFIPGQGISGTTYLTQPIGLVVQGRFIDISRFVAQLRTLVRVKKGRLDARGRLYSITQVDLNEPDDDRVFPIVKATVTLNAFTFTAPGTGTVEPSQSTTPSSNGTVAAGVTP